MEHKSDTDEKTGLYLGTEIDEKWWRRYAKDKLLVRGNGKYWDDDQAFYFLRDLSKEPIRIPFDKIKEFKTGKWHSGRWCLGLPILKIVWTQEGLRLSSGFFVSKSEEDVRRLIADLKKKRPA